MPSAWTEGSFERVREQLLTECRRVAGERAAQKLARLAAHADQIKRQVQLQIDDLQRDRQQREQSQLAEQRERSRRRREQLDRQLREDAKPAGPPGQVGAGCAAPARRRRRRRARRGHQAQVAVMNLGIDLGTTFSLAGYLNPQGVPTLVPDAAQPQWLRTPSVVGVQGRQAWVGPALEARLAGLAAAQHRARLQQHMGTDAAPYTDEQGRAWPPEALSALVLGLSCCVTWSALRRAGGACADHRACRTSAMPSARRRSAQRRWPACST